MIWIAVFLVIALLLSNLMALIPSKGERKVMKLRQKAYESGLKVHENTDIEQDGRWFDYVLLKKHGLGSVRYCREGNGWVIKNTAAVTAHEIPKQLELLPAGVIQVDVKLGRVSACWDEKGTVTDAAQVATVLKQLIG
ncbi:hypothetical protein ACWJJH_17485 [Endozoicomonadaceae bacterium StTr2]